MARRFAAPDVFTARAPAGNPVAVALDSDGLDAGAMQAVARALDPSETVFASAPAEQAVVSSESVLHV